MVPRSFAALSFLLGISSTAAPETELDAEQILARAIDVQRQHREENPEAKYDYKLRAVSEKLDGDGEVEEIDERLYQSHPIEGEPYDRLIQKDGRDLTEDELEEEAEREKEFREQLRDDAADGGGNDRIDFDEDLVSRFEVTLQDVQSLEGRSCYVISFSPRKADLPTARRIDHVINKARGRIWIDRESYEVARVQFELSEKVKLLWGIVGSISTMTGQLERRPVDGDVWLMERFDLSVTGRALFSSYHVRQRFTWDEYALLGRMAGSP